MGRIVIDTNIFVSAIMNKHGAPRQVLRLALQGDVVPIMGNALFSEYEDLLARDALFKDAPITLEERAALFDAVMSISVWVTIYYLWRPNLRDEADNHLVELALAGGAKVIVSANKRDLLGGELQLGELRVLTAGEFIEERRKT